MAERSSHFCRPARISRIGRREHVRRSRSQASARYRDHQRSGARFGPQAIRQASRMLVDGAHPTAWINISKLLLSDIGDFRIALGDIPASLKAIEEQAAAVDHLVALGKEHGITLALLRALARRKGPLALVHFDAHVDTWPDNFGQPYAHGSVFDHAIEEHLVIPHRMIQIGIRSPVQRDVFDRTVARGVTIVSSEEVHGRRPKVVAEHIRSIVGEEPRYLSFDIDRWTGFCAGHRHARNRRTGVVAGTIDPPAPEGGAFRRDGRGRGRAGLRRGGDHVARSRDDGL